MLYYITVYNQYDYVKNCEKITQRYQVDNMKILANIII